jgi:hypothetical protein
MDQKEFEGKLDEYANKISATVGEGVKKVEEAFDKGRENLKADAAEGEGEGERGGFRGMKGSPKSGIVLIGAGIVWLLYIAGFFQQWIFPILVIALGIYFIVRNR